LLNPDLTIPSDFGRSTAFHNYLDEFLAAIRIFGFLEKPVFHELSRHLQTKRLIAGETISLDADDKEGFVCVVDGNVQVFAHSAGSGSPSPESPYNGYQLLNEVATGGTVSSLFTILRLFTEDVKLSWEGEGLQESEHPHRSAPTSAGARSDDGLGGISAPESYEDVKRTDCSQSPYVRPEGSISQLDLSSSRSESDHTEGPAQRYGIVAESPAQDPIDRIASGGQPFRNPMSAVTSTHSEANSRFNGTAKSNQGRQRHTTAAGDRPAVIARATVDTTLAVIPFEAFTRLRHKFPKATGQIVSVILTRFARVTFMTGQFCSKDAVPRVDVWLTFRAVFSSSLPWSNQRDFTG
jgi:lysophospholipid hydrolase